MRHTLLALALLTPAPLAAQGFDVFACVFGEGTDLAIITYAFHTDDVGNARDLDVPSASVTVDPDGNYTSVRGGTVVRIAGGMVRAMTDDVLISGTCNDISYQIERVVMAARMTDVGGGETLMEQELRALLETVRSNEQSATAQIEGLRQDLALSEAIALASDELNRRWEANLYAAMLQAMEETGMSADDRIAFFLAMLKHAERPDNGIDPTIRDSMQEAVSAAVAD